MKNLEVMASGISERILEFRPPRIAMGMILIAAAVHWLMPVSVSPPSLAAGAVTVVSGFLIMLRAWWLFRIQEVAICPTEETTSLITHDIYSVTRNPMYLGMILMLLGIALAVGTLPFYCTAFAYFVIIDFVFCPYEEQKLRNTFGEAFFAYQRQVRRWV
jgi:protein-S-isoprenylcysteine O-methyltransferase Ste14